MRRARQSGIPTEFEPIAVGAYQASVLAAEPFPAEGAQRPVAPDPPKAKASERQDDREIQEIFFDTYPEKVWGGRNEARDRLLRLLAKVERHPR
jgi:hypothetical protein